MTTERISLELIELPRPASGIVRRLLAAVALWRHRVQQRQVLSQLDERMLRDIGLTPADVWRETRLPPWHLY
jgi:uncharacterized protein YjiS (DUF1127 family)